MAKAKKICYRVYGGDPGSDPRRTCVDITRIASPNVYSHATQVLRRRFKGRLKNINHAGKTIKLKEWDDYSGWKLAR